MFYFKDDKQLSVYFSDGSIGVWEVTNPEIAQVEEACKKSNWLKVAHLHNQAKTILNNYVTIKDNKLVINVKDSDETLEMSLKNNDSTIVSFINILKEKGVIDTEIERIKPFLINMFENPYIESVTELYDYCKAQDFEITEDGCFLAYKKVREDLGSVHDLGRTKHTIGEYTEVKEFDTDRHRDCSSGLHFCSRSYLRSFAGETTIIVKVNPKDVVAIPTDYNFAKGRCKKYYVVGILGKEGTLATTNIEEVSEGTVKIVKTKERTKADKKLAKNKAKQSSGGRIEETISLMKTHKNNIEKVAKIMNISVETVKRNIRKHKAKNK